MVINDYAGLPAPRGAFEPIASRLAPTQAMFICGIPLAQINYQM
ncbi:hypothetical protein BJ917_3540 [Pseudomonas sp. WPR_5_2]|nr:hypothetical protein BJ917_3540 [Pseudomonas sp. WPR_5_2]